MRRYLTAVLGLVLAGSALCCNSSNNKNSGDSGEKSASAGRPSQCAAGEDLKPTGRRACIDEMIHGIYPENFESVVHAHYNSETGVSSLRANGWIFLEKLKLKSRKFRFIDMWRYDPAEEKWFKLDRPAPVSVEITADSARTPSGPYTNQELIRLTDGVGLYWVRWLEDGRLVQMPVLAGPIMPQDYCVLPPPPSMVIAGIPYKDHAEVRYIPDPQKFFLANPPDVNESPSTAVVRDDIKKDCPPVSEYPYLKPEQRPQKAKEALAESTDEKDRFQAVWGLAISGYCRESAEALAAVACDGRRTVTTRIYAAMGLSNFTSAMPDDVREPIRKKLLGALAEEREKLPDGVIRTLISWGDADSVREMLGGRFHGHPMEVDVLRSISSRDDAIASLMELYEAAPEVTGQLGWNSRWRIGEALIHRRDKRGIDILIECLSVKNPWPTDGQSPQAKASSEASFRQCLHNTFEYIARTLDEDFGYGSCGGTWRPDLPEAIPKMVEWWKANRDTWSFEEATSTVVPEVRPGRPLTKRQARVLAAKLATDAFAEKNFKHPNGEPAGKIEITPESFRDVSQKDSRWVLRMVRSAGPEASVDFALDGTDAKVIVNYAWR